MHVHQPRLARCSLLESRETKCSVEIVSFFEFLELGREELAFVEDRRRGWTFLAAFARWFFESRPAAHCGIADRRVGYLRMREFQKINL